MTQWTPNHENHPNCVICQLPILPTEADPGSNGFNAEPIAAGRCCNTCDEQIVRTTRLSKL